MMSRDAGERNAYITIQGATYPGTDSLGAATKTYANDFTRWALYIPKQMAEASNRSARDESFLFAEFHIDFDPTLWAAMSGDMRIIWETETWEVKSWRKRRAMCDEIVISARRGE